MKNQRSYDPQKPIEKCFLYSRTFNFGANLYDGRAIRFWGIMVCNSCDRSNRDGLVTARHPKLMHYLIELGVEVNLNPSGWLDFPK